MPVCFMLIVLTKYLKTAILDLQMAFNRTHLKLYPFDVAALKKLVGYPKSRV